MPLGIPHTVFLSWDPQDQDKALAYRRTQLELCPRCKTRASDWETDRLAYIGQQEHCMGCQVLEEEMANVEERARAYTHVYLIPPELARDPEEEEK